MPQMHLRQSRFTCSTCWPFTKNKEHKNLKESGHSRHIYQNKLDKGHFQHDVAYGDFKDLPKRTASAKLSNGLALMVYIFFDKKAKDNDTCYMCRSAAGGTIKLCWTNN